jgi:hypothetical protein
MAAKREISAPFHLRKPLLGFIILQKLKEIYLKFSKLGVSPTTNFPAGECWDRIETERSVTVE